MAGLKLTEFDIANTLDGTEPVGTVQNGINVQTTAADIAALAVGGAANEEFIRDTMGTALVGGTDIDITVDDVGNTITVDYVGTVTQYTDEMARDALGAAIVGGIAVTSTVDDGANTITLDAVQEWAPNWTDDADVYIPAEEAMTISQGNAEIGTGTITYEKSTTAAPETFASTSLPVTLQAGAWLRVIASGVTGFCATHLKRTA